MFYKNLVFNFLNHPMEKEVSLSLCVMYEEMEALLQACRLLRPGRLTSEPLNHDHFLSWEKDYVFGKIIKVYGKPVKQVCVGFWRGNFRSGNTRTRVVLFYQKVNTFLSVQCNLFSSRHLAPRQVSRTDSSCRMECSFWRPTHKPPPPAPGKHRSALCSYEADYFRFLI